MSVSTRTVAGVSFRPQISAHTGTNASISTTATTRAGTAIDLTCPCARRTAPPSGESRRSMRDESDTRRARHRSRRARLLGALRFATRGGSQGTPPPPPERNQRFAAGAVRRLRRHPGLCMAAGGADEILSEGISDQHRGARTGLLRAGLHSWPLPRSVPRADARGRESPVAGNHLAEANRSAKSSPAGSASQRPSTNHRTPVRAEPVRTSNSIALRDVENPATLRVRCGSSSPLLRSRPSDRSSVHGGTGAR